MAPVELKAVANRPSGEIPPGASIVVSVHGPTGRDSAPDVGYEWVLKRNGVRLNTRQLSQIFEGNIPHTTDRRDFNGKLYPEVTGILDLTLRGTDASTRQLNERWTWTVAKSSPAKGVFDAGAVTKADLDALEERILKAIEDLRGTVN